MEEKINKLINSCLSNCNLPFTYTSVDLVKSNYYDEGNYMIELNFSGYNGTDEVHTNIINCYDGNLSQIMFENRGFPGASLCFDRGLIPEAIVKSLSKVAYFDNKYRDLKNNSGNKKANI